MEQKKPKGQKGFAVVNIIAGVIVTMAGIMVVAEGEVMAFLAVVLGLVLWIMGAYMLRLLKRTGGDMIRGRGVYIAHTVCFVLSLVILGGLALLSVVGSLLF